MLRARRKPVAIVAVCLFYIAAYCATTHLRWDRVGLFEPPMKLRVFQSEPHLVVFYPVFMLERWIRNGSFIYCLWFDCGFADSTYIHPWLWGHGDGKNSPVWYANWEGGGLFLAAGAGVAFLVWKWGRRAPHWAILWGLFSGFIAVGTLHSATVRKNLESGCGPLREQPPTLSLKMTGPSGRAAIWGRDAYFLGLEGRNLMAAAGGDPSIGDRIVAIREDSFLIRFRLKRAGQSDDEVLIAFPFDQLTETNWNGWHFEGKFNGRFGY